MAGYDSNAGRDLLPGLLGLDMGLDMVIDFDDAKDYNPAVSFSREKSWTVALVS